MLIRLHGTFFAYTIFFCYLCQLILFRFSDGGSVKIFF